MSMVNRSAVAPSESSEWHDLGGAHIWLPYTQMQTAAEPLMVDSAKGSILTLADGRQLVDGVCSWWTACHGYRHPVIEAAVADQLARLPHVMFGGLNHLPALTLAKRLAAVLPGDLAHVFFSDSGSVAVEVAMKMAVQFWLNQGVKGRTRFVSFRNAYHGDTMGPMSICDPEEGMHALFAGYMPRQHVVNLPVDADGRAALDRLLSDKRDEIAGVFIEPLVQGVGGMSFHDPQVLSDVAALCRRHGHLLIADEIMTGFGRTGTMFACEQAGVVPDIICLGKALSAGTITLAATVTGQRVYQAFLSDDPLKALMHGPTYMANPLACAAANASLDIFASEPCLERVGSIAERLRDGLAACRFLPGIVDVRVRGAIGVVQLDRAADKAWFLARTLPRNVWVRTFGEVMYLMPAFNIPARELDTLIEAVVETIGEWSRDVAVSGPHGRSSVARTG